MTDRPSDDSASADTNLTKAQPSFVPARETIGPYRLLERVGEGGMGEVWLAEQIRPVQRQVALKIIKAGMDTTQVVARFEAERRRWRSCRTLRSPRCSTPAPRLRDARTSQWSTSAEKRLPRIAIDID